MVLTGRIGDFRRVAGELHRRLCEFVHRVVVHRRDEAFCGWRNWLREDLKFTLTSGCGLTWCFLPLFSTSLILLRGGSGVLADPAKIDEEFRKAWLPHICRSGQREASLEEFAVEVDGWLTLLPEISLPALTGEMLAEVVRREGVTAGSLDGWGWREMKALPVAWFDGLARILSKVEEVGVWLDGLLDGLLDANIAMIPKAD